MSLNALIDIASSNSYQFTGVSTDDVVVYTTSETQNIHIGSKNNANPSMFMSTSNISFTLQPATSNNSISFYTNNGATRAMSILGTGYIGVNKQYPQYQLDIAGTVNATAVYVGGAALSANTGGGFVAGATNSTTTACNVNISGVLRVSQNAQNQVTIESDGANDTSIICHQYGAGAGTDVSVAKIMFDGYTYTDQGSCDIRFFTMCNSTTAGNLTERMVISKSGNIGIGNSTPSYKLDVSGIVNASALYVGGSPYIGSQWTTTTSNIYYTTGNVGIGTNAPAKTLHVAGDLQIDNTLYINNSIAMGGLHITKNNAGGQGNIVSGITQIPGYTYDSNVTLTSLNSSFDVIMKSGTTEIMRCDGANNSVGIGISAPTSKLHVLGTTRFMGNSPANAFDTIIGNMLIKTYNKSLTTTALDFTNICTLTSGNGGCTVYMDVIQNENNSIESKSYIIPISWFFSANYYRVNPIASSILAGNDFAVELNNNGAANILRLVRVSGTTSTANFTCTLRVFQNQNNTISLTDNTTTGSSAANSGFWGSAVLTQVGGNVGIGTGTPTTALHVVGAVNATTDLQVNGTSISTTYAPKAGPTFTGTLTAATVAATTITGAGSGITALSGTNIASGTVPVLYGGTGVGTSTGTGSVVLSAGPTLTGTVSAAAINTTGWVGIGTATPIGPVHVVPTGVFAGTVATTISTPTVAGTGTAFLSTLVAGDNITISAVSYTVLSIANNTTLTLTGNASATVSGVAYSTTTVKNSLTMLRNGFVGIGTNAPTTGLQVVGGLTADNMNIPGTLTVVNVTDTTIYSSNVTASNITSVGIISEQGASLVSKYALSNHDAAAITAGTLPVLRGGTGVTTSTGTGSVVLSAGPTFTGTVSAAALNTTGNVGIGSATPGTKLDVLGTTRFLGNAVANVFDTTIGNMLIRTYNKSLTGTALDFTNICVLTSANGGLSVYLDIIHNETGSSESKSYIVPISWIGASANYYRINPIASTGAYSGNQDWVVEINVNSTAITLRLVRLSGSGSTANFTCTLRVFQSQANVVTITDSATTGSAAANSGIYSSTPLTQVTGFVGIGTATPSQKLHVYNTGSSSYIRLSGDVAQQQGIELFDSASRWLIYKPGNSTDIRWWNGASDAMTLTNAGVLTVNGSGITSLSGTNITSGTVPVAYGGTGVSSSTGTGSVVLSANPTFTGTVTAAALTLSGTTTAGPIVVQNNIDGTSAKGIYMWLASDPSWGIYMGTSGAGKSLANGTATGGAGFSSHAIRLRVSNSSTQGIIIENSAETALMSIRGSDGLGYFAGSVGIGTTSPSTALHVNGTLTCNNFVGNTNQSMVMNVTAAYAYYWQVGGGYVMSLSAGGALTTISDITGFSTISDVKFKENIETLTNNLDIISKLRPVEFTWKNNIQNVSYRGLHDYGLIAQELEEVIPEAVKEAEMNGETYKTVKHERIIPFLVGSIQELQRENEILRVQNRSLNDRLTRLENLFNA